MPMPLDLVPLAAPVLLFADLQVLGGALAALLVLATARAWTSALRGGPIRASRAGSPFASRSGFARNPAERFAPCHRIAVSFRAR